MRYRHVMTVYLLMLVWATSVFAAKTAELKFTKQTDLPNIGLSIKLMSNSKTAPIPPPSVYTYTFNDQSGSTWKEEKYEPWALWYATQHGGRWIDSYNNALTMAKITCPCLHNMQSKHVTRARFKSLTDAVYSGPIEWSDEELRNWVKDFTKGSQVKSERVTISSFKIKDVIRFYIDNDPTQMSYAFKLNTAATGQAKAPGNYFFFHIKLVEGADPNKTLRALNSYFIKSIQMSKTKGNGTRTASTKFQIKKRASLLSRRNAPERSAEFIESRNQVASSIRNMKDWWFINTENYIILSNLSMKHKVMVKELQTDIEYLRNAYAKVIPPRKEISAVSVLRVFATSQEYLAYVGAEHQWSGGLWMPSKKEMIIRPIDWGKSKDQRARVKRVTYHEAFHQYLHYALDQSRTSVWFNEGNAEFFETAEIRNKKLEIKEDEYKAEELIKMIAANTVDIQSLLKMDYKDFYCGSDEKRGENYTLAWGIVYYLRKGAKFDKPASHTKLLDNYVDALWKTKDPAKATEIAFSATNPHKFQKDFISFWTSKTKRSSARRNKIFK